MSFLSRLLANWLNRPEVLSAPLWIRATRYVEDLGDAQTPHDDEIIFVGSAKIQKWAVIRCPCGCGHVLNVNLMRTHHPHWNLQRHEDGTMTILPSLWVKDAKCRSHFFLHRNRTVWAQGDGYDERWTRDDDLAGD
jgi:Family of unknown function (DUF6527)